MTAAERLDPAWFGAVMGTGGVAAVAAANPGGWSFAAGPARVLAAGLLMLAAVLLLGLAARAARGRHLSVADLRDPAIGPAYGTLPGAVLVLDAAFVGVAPRVLDTAPGWWAVAGWTLLGTLLAVAVTVLLFVAAFEHADFDAAQISGTWFIPETAVLLGGYVAAQLARTAPAGLSAGLTLTALVLLGAGGVLFALTAVVFFNRLILLPQHAGGAAGMWVMISPLSVTVLVVAAASGSAGGPVPAIAIALAVVLWGFALWWILAAGLLTWHNRGDVLRRGPGDWAYVFPPAAMTIATLTLARRWDSGAIELLGVLFSLLLLLVWAVVAGASLRRVTAGPAPR
jgi:tellurite resistance protein TehA-like permease